MKNRFVHYGLVLLIIAGVSAGILGYVNKLTSPIIKENTQKSITLAMKNVLPNAEKFDIDNKIISKDGKSEFTPGYANNQIVGYVTTVTQGGYAGDIVFVMGIDTEGKVTGINVTNSQETPGLGAKIQGKTWQDHWIGVDSSYEFNKRVDAFAGATISPEAVYTGMMRRLNTFKAEVNN